ncbi:hypothetical protein CRI93_03325 [Longimonas halophila]|uniref:Putative restriction endonuclease domain-containing protein n=1 Tax=Longimonas halophila TaxID=1469170 RepID=A0A2H3NPB9_9BACT|nr:Uma2 family endonuclease [Longimonas halophila]PEN08800.1 hypothetical protein CRI93_03325 [Longimonas halophila]
MPSASRTAPRTWAELCNDPSLQDLPYKIETNARGQIVMSPTYAWHGKYAYRIARLLEDHLPDGQVSVELAIRTTEGTKVADAIWCSVERWGKIKDAYDAPIAPEICVEVLSPANTEAEMEAKQALYFEAGAKEVWLCDAEGTLSFYDASGARDRSRQVPSFPAQIES